MHERYHVSEIAFALHKFDSLVLTESNLYLGHANASSRQLCCAFAKPDYEDKNLSVGVLQTRLDPVTPPVCILCLNWAPINDWIIRPERTDDQVRTRTSLALANVDQSRLRAEAHLGYCMRHPLGHSYSTILANLK